MALLSAAVGNGLNKKSARQTERPVPAARGFIALALCLLALWLPAGCTSSGGPTGTTTMGSEPLPERGTIEIRVAQQICITAKKQKGIMYRSGGITPQSGFDCSGLIYWVYNQYGFNLPRNAKDQSGYGLPVSKKQLEPGDLVAFKTPSGYHTGIYLGKNIFLHSPSTGSRVRENNLNEAYWKKYFVCGRRVI